MRKTKTDSAIYIAKTAVFFALVGSFIGTALLSPFSDTITHHPFKFPHTALLLLLGYLIFGVPASGTAGLVYGICLVSTEGCSKIRFRVAFLCGVFPSFLLMALGYIWNPRTPTDSLIVATCLMVFTGLSSLMTAWVHWRSEARFKFLQMKRHAEICMASS